jgi:acetylornithine/N-succinyldiaminopimelate aminotransferase
MTTDAIMAQEAHYLLPTYNKMPVALERGSGVHLWDTEGTCYLDFYGGHCVALLGHCHPRVTAAIQRQAAQLQFYSNVSYSPVRARAAQKLASLAPEGLGHVFFANSGSEANETALKMGRQWTGKPGVIAMEGGFHGRTLGSLAVTASAKYRAPHTAVLPPTHFAPFGDVDAVEQLLTQHDDIGTLILEPIQSIAGMRMAPPAYYRALRVLCNTHDVVLVFDEVQTGVGRTGTFSISQQLGMVPDIITLAKSLGAGMPVSAVLVSDALAAMVEPGDQGSTFGGGMLAMAAVEATMDVLAEDALMARAAHVHERLAAGLAPYVSSIRGLGCLIGVEMPMPVKPLLAALRAEGVLAGGSGDPQVLRLMPPLITPDDAIDACVAAFANALDALHEPVLSSP